MVGTFNPFTFKVIIDKYDPVAIYFIVLGLNLYTLFVFPGKEIITQVQETQRVPNRINPRQNTPTHILITLRKIKHKEQILKAPREKQQITHKGIPIRITADLSIETLQARREWQGLLKVMKENTYSPDYCTQQESHSNMKEKSKALQTSKS